MDTTRQLKCAKCGGAIAVQSGEDMAFCEYCGSYSNPDGTVYFPDHDARIEALRQKMGKAIRKDDREQWRRLCFEYCLLSVQLHPEQHPAAPADDDGFRKYVSQQVRMYELLAFDDGVKEAFAACQQVINNLMQVTTGHVAAARTLLDAYRRYFNAFLHHPDYPYETKPGDAEQQAVDTSRSAVNQFAPLWGREVIKEIMVAVFGDRKTASGQVYCDSCGMLQEAGELSSVKCPSCGSVTYINK